MADSKKYNGSTWEHSLRKLTTATDTLTSLPADLYADGNNATVGLVGNMSQSGTPSPDNPIQPSECGERTENLLSLADVSTQTINGIEFSVDAQNGTVTINGTAILNQDTSFNVPIDSTLNGDFYVSGCPDGGSYQTYDIFVWDETTRARVRKWDGTTGMDSVLNANESSEIQLIQNHSIVVRIRVRYGIQFDNLEFKPMIRIPTAPSAFEPYGYKIPILSASTTTPVYLGEVQTTRKIKKLVLTGEETDWIKASDYNVFANTGLTPDVNNASDTTTIMCSHYEGQSNVTGARRVDDLRCCFRASSKTLYIGDNTYTDLNDFLLFLQQQYAAGTPVTVWYVLAIPTTGIVNEPIRKIGDYADTVSGITIPTITGKDTFDVETTLKPSEVSLSYTGWHDASAKEWDGSEWQ